MYSAVPFKPLLTHADLPAIRERQSWNADVMALTWEVKRLCSVLLRAYQVSDDFKRPAGITGYLFDEFMTGLPAE